MKNILTITALLISIPLHSDTFSVRGETSYYEFESEPGISIKSIEQYPEGLFVVTNNYAISTTGWIPVPPIVIRSSEPLYLHDVPSIAVYNVVTSSEDALSDRVSGIKIYDEVAPDVIVPINFDQLNDWIDVIGLGRVNIKNYPWIIHEDFGALYISESHFVSGELGYWIYKEDYGWSWTTRDRFPEMFSIDLEEWFTLL